LRGQGAGLVVDGPFAETKEHLLGFYVESPIEAARDLRRANPIVVYELRPKSLYRPGRPFPVMEAGSEEDQAL